MACSILGARLTTARLDPQPATRGLFVARLRDWQSRLALVMSERARQPWARGRLDCCGFAGACVSAVTGVDPLERWGAWSNTREAMRILRRHGGLRAAVGEQLGAEIPPACAQPGDVGLYVSANGEDGLAVWGGGAWHAPARSGLVLVDPSAITIAWRCCGVANG